MKPIISDKILRETVVNELESDPEVAAKHISVTAIDGAITLAGHVMTMHEKRGAMRAAERVPAVRAVADEIEVRPPSPQLERADDEIAEEIAHLRSWSAEIPDSVAAEVREGRVILRGEVESQSQRDAAASAVRQFTGVRVVDNLITVTPRTEPTAAAHPRERGGGRRGGVFLVVRFRAPDYARLKRVFDDFQPLRERHGARGHRILRLADDPQDFVVVIDFASVGGAHSFTEDPELLNAIDAAGIEGGAHHVQYVEEFREQLEAVEYFS